MLSQLGSSVNSNTSNASYRSRAANTNLVSENDGTGDGEGDIVLYEHGPKERIN